MPRNPDTTRPISDGRKYEAFDFWSTPRKDRVFTEAQFRSQHRFNLRQWKDLKTEWTEAQQVIAEEMELRKTYMKAHPLAQVVPEEVFEMPEDQAQAFKDKVFELAMQGRNAQYARLWAQMAGLVEKDDKTGDNANILQVVIAALKSTDRGD